MNLHIQSGIVWEWPPMELRAERGRWVSEIRSNIGRRRAGEVSTIHYAASWSVSKTIYRPLTRGKHWLSRHPHRVTCRRVPAAPADQIFFLSARSTQKYCCCCVSGARCPISSSRHCALSSHQFSRNENSLSWFLRKQQAFKVKVADAGGGWNRKMVSVSVNWQNVSLPGCDEYFINLIWELIIHFETTPFSAKSPNKTSTRRVIQLRCSKLLCAGVWRNIFLIDMTAATF